MLSPKISDIAIITVKNVDYRCIMYSINKSEAIPFLENSVLGDCGYKKILSIQDTFFNFFCLEYTKWLILWSL